MPQNEATPLEDTRDYKTFCKNAMLLNKETGFDNADECKSFFEKNPDYLPTAMYNQFTENGELKQFKYKERSGHLLAKLIPPLGGHIGIKSKKLSDTAAECGRNTGTRLVNVVDEKSKTYVRPVCIPDSRDYDNYDKIYDMDKDKYYDMDKFYYEDKSL